ncbi:hypothetical protein LTR78_007445 [Recurvomyces mirabilis]|uniref:NACHT domain-containing protein n=1 Tax=Recurvomyces mirabilis TaxID=574656 RepID=A0AAE0WG44_9PEZI|nr:hypothetical protein LTR78_007445 [Recurvomyces mirabilis]KAK5160046.1 hypothetical protein LTS14_002152 [Recurvomyces mirabilis]
MAKQWGNNLSRCSRWRNTNGGGYQKVEAFATYVREHLAPIRWLWVDTCCINKDSAAELSEAINSMFDWYLEAELCLSYLADVETAEDGSGFEKSEWFTRGWTLQDDKLKWMDGRTTTRPEDTSYALYGAFDVTPGANYGEGHKGARHCLMAAVDHRVNEAAQQVEDYRKIVGWLSPPDPQTNHASARQRHEDKTGVWLLRCDQYTRWKAGALDHVWMYGKAGCGKTILRSTLVEDIRAYCQGEVNIGLAVFYFSFSDDQKQTYPDLMRSLVAQLGWKEPSLTILRQAYDKPNASVPGADELEKILCSSFETHDKVFLLLDALDECPEVGDIRQEMMQRIEGLAQRAANLKIFATSREQSDIRESMEILQVGHINIATRAVDTDIGKYVSSEMSRDRRLARFDLVSKTAIEKTIAQKGDGM